ncbi:subclass B1 metallo-beta-lactamase [Aquimarina sp. TRL1]|uniref:subclass B1 metallo-beta-lactamase n=1 Tax=Aquimarina sp. (strain TRL1) TaxID=2736252 RepID=UPI00158CE6AF|nr:subclass B1 metallo-beta-lactamase [Aquimarina sp. TRL1]QKX06023.1 subclass B1 metallo-beta-lactamase [Aquimarina sp. TRL1]
MNKLFSSYIGILIFFLSCKHQKEAPSYVYESSSMKIIQLSPHAYQHITYLKTKEYGNVPCNGMIVTDTNEAIVFDTPADNKVATELINWIEDSLSSTITGVVTTHFHIDCLGGLQAFHDRKIPSYANTKTIDLVKSAKKELPKNGFDTSMEIKVGTKKVINSFIGEGHTADNIISYFPSEKILFGGCLIKSLGAKKGNLNDANVQEWSETVKRIASKYNEVEIVIPGHGATGNQELLQYTIELFQNSSVE